ncbi:hypothetical protein E5Q_05555 [Mixia osmundae IAM 14324]|uniref:Purine nucleoside permease n=1 Tax=Mixia osmundae (strain CBS 9802 / IAM 14324 / JCM 22182 / KY 12970) TaxID=764103 RepID=G7E7Q7_MIXOS|nr:hypothetical protein E5Q_05555 [Mixia osmundae IAM 14324]
MRTILCTVLLALAALGDARRSRHPRNVRATAWHDAQAKRSSLERRTETLELSSSGKVAPKVLVISMFAPEASVWFEPYKLVHNITVPGLSVLYPQVHCNSAGSVCLYTTGESEINAASSGSALFQSALFDFTKTYFLIAGIAGVNPYHGTLGTAAFAAFTLQPTLQYFGDHTELAKTKAWGNKFEFWAFGTNQTGVYPSELYGTELYQVNTNLLKRALSLTKNVKLNDSSTAQAYRKRFDYAPANQPPTVVQGDVLTSDDYFFGHYLGYGFGNYTKLLTNGTGTYVMTAQEDSATAEALLRATVAKKADFSRLMILRTASDIDRAPPGVDEYTAFEYDQGGFEPSIANLYLAGSPVVNDILAKWNTTYEAGIAPQKDGFYGNILGTLRS